MNLHEHNEDFFDLASITANRIGIPVEAVIRDYYLVMMLQKLERSEFADKCIFKGGTSLSKCYPGSIERFSEDIDITFFPDEELSKNQYDKSLKKIEKIMSSGFNLEKIIDERNDRNKSSFVWFGEEYSNFKIKLEIGSVIRPDPYEKMTCKTYIHEFLESIGNTEAISQYELKSIMINTLRIERTFLDKVMSVKRHACCGTLPRKVRHIYDVTMLMKRDDIKRFLENTEELKHLLQITKETDRFYLEKRPDFENYDPTGPYCFSSWRSVFDSKIKKTYESLHENLLYTNQKQEFQDAIIAFETVDSVFNSIDE